MAATTHKKVPAKHILAVVMGNALEFYDFLTFAFFAVYIGRAFFPSDDPTGSLLATLATFGAGFITRPIGGLIIGSMGDRLGRRPAMMLSFSLMGVAIVGLALTPSYESIGIVAPILVLGFRLLQGFALGGEVGPTTAFLIEAAPPHRRGIFSSLQYTTQDLAVLTAGIVGVTLASLMDEKQLQDWGWRIAMLVGALIIPVGLYIRRSLPETLFDKDAATADALPPRAKFRPYIRIVALGLMMLAAGTIASYVINYMTTYAINTLKLAANVAFGATVVSGLCGVIFQPISGFLSDKFGRKPVMLIPGALLLLSVIPVFYMIEGFRSPIALYGGTAILSMFIGLSTPPVLTGITESLPRGIRSGVVATLYAFAIATFGGTTQFLITWLIDFTGNPLAPAYYMTGAGLIGYTAMLLTRESAPVKVGIKH